MPAANNRATVNSARLLLTRLVRDDWDAQYPLPGSQDNDWQLSNFDPSIHVVGWRERYHSSPSCSDLDVAHCADDNGAERAAERLTQPYGQNFPEKMDEEKLQLYLGKERNRRRAADEEIRWNDGLRYWTRRRDAWTEARYVGTACSSDSSMDSSNIPIGIRAQEAASLLEPPTQRSAVSDRVPSPDDLASSRFQLHSGRSEESKPRSKSIALLPVPPPLFPITHPIRSAITESRYLDIYTKVVVSGRSPLVPINLLDMTRIIVHGWKESGEWPPKASGVAPDPLPGRRRKRPDTNEVQKLVTVGFDVHARDQKHRVHAEPSSTTGSAVRHPHLRKGLESVKRVLQLSAIGPDEV